MKMARDKGLSISFDPNLRRKLWSEELARQTLLEMLPLCDLFLPGHEECEFLFGPGTPQEWTNKALNFGPQLVVLKQAERGALAATKDGIIEAPPFKIASVVDPIGAGDAFAAGFLSAWLDVVADSGLLIARQHHRRVGHTISRRLGRFANAGRSPANRSRTKRH